MKKEPLISIAIPCYKAQDYVHQALESLSEQTYKNLEVFVVSDDGMDYSSVTSSFQNKLDLHHISTHGIATGWVNAKNIAFRKAQGKIFSQLDADDSLDASYFERLLPRVMNEGACVTPRQPVYFLSNTPFTTQGLKNGYSNYVKKKQLEISEFIHIPFGWQTLYRSDLITTEWQNYFEDDLYFDCQIFEKIGYAPFESYFGYFYNVRQGSICHSDGSPERVIASYKTVLIRLEDKSDGMGLTTQTRNILIKELNRRIANIQRFLCEQTEGTLIYEPETLIDIIHYPQKN